MRQNDSRHDYRMTIALVAFVLFAFVLLATLLAPGTLPLIPVLPVLIAMLRVALKAFKDR